MIAIVTKRTPSGRIVATAGDRRITINPAAGVSGDDAHKRAALALCQRYGWGGVLAMGDIDHHSRAFVWVPRTTATLDGTRLLDLIIVEKTS